MIQLHQVLAVANPDEHGQADVPLRLRASTAR